MTELRIVEIYRGAVYPWQCDQNGHLNLQQPLPSQLAVKGKAVLVGASA